MQIGIWTVSCPHLCEICSIAWPMKITGMTVRETNQW